MLAFKMGAGLRVGREGCTFLLSCGRKGSNDSSPLSHVIEKGHTDEHW